MTLTPNMAYAAGMDAGNRSMRAGNRVVWNEDDYNAASEVTNHLLDQLEGKICSSSAT
jgi:hypothetical protein